ncbi:MAG TPA: hypothetical protein VKA51_03970 [Rubrobacteraceae bacterium]|nr:hypothetical protein [Rubrobacteraceae bacterium]
MSDEKNEYAKRVEPGPVEQKGVTEWIAAGSAAVSTATQLYQTFKRPGPQPPQDTGKKD